jgi:hypothetical protein
MVMPYSIEDRRSLTTAEIELLRFLLGQECPARLQEIDRLHVVARCGCGECPTVLFSGEANGEPKTGPFHELASFSGRNNRGELVGVALLERAGEISELEAWSPEGSDITAWPPIKHLQRLEKREVGQR